MYPVRALKTLAKKLDEVAFVVDALVAKRLVAVAEVNTDEEPLRLENIPVVLLSVVTVADADVRLVVDAVTAVKLVVDAVVIFAVPVALRLFVFTVTKLPVVAKSDVK